MAASPPVLDRLRSRYRWLDHALRAQQRYDDCEGDFYAAGLTYFTIFAIFPLLMVGFATGGFVLSRRPDLLHQIDDRIRAAISGDTGQQLIDLMDSAIDSRTSVGIIGLAIAGWTGLSWMDKLREALSRMRQQPVDGDGFVSGKLSDLLALLSAFAASVITIGLTTLADPAVMRTMLGWVGVHDLPLLDAVLRTASLAMSLLVSWLLFSWIIARLPRRPTSFTGSMRAGLIAAVGFEGFKQAGSIYLRSVLDSPAGATFGPVLGLMVFAYITARLVLFATAWAAVSESGDDVAAAPAAAVAPIGPAAIVVAPARSEDGLDLRPALAAAAVGAVGALLVSRLLRRRPRG